MAPSSTHDSIGKAHAKQFTPPSPPMSSPSANGPNMRPGRRPSVVTLDDHFPLGTRSGTLVSLIRNRSQQSLAGSYHSVGHRYGPDDEEALLSTPRGGIGMTREDEEIGKLLMDERRMTRILNGPQVRSMNLIGKSNPRYRWERYWKQQHELDGLEKPIRKYYERTNELIEQYLYIDRLLDSSIPHELLDEYCAELDASAFRPQGVPDTIDEEGPSPTPQSATPERANPLSYGSVTPPEDPQAAGGRLPAKRTPKDIFRSSENLPLLQHADDDDGDDASVHEPQSTAAHGPKPNLPWLENAEVDSEDPIVNLAIWVNMIANLVLLAGKIVVVISVPSMSVLASLVDAMLDFLSTAIVWTTTRLISSSQKDQYHYPVGRRRLEPVGVLVFSIIMITSFCQVFLECIQRLAGPNHEILHLGVPAIAIMVSTIVIKGACWLWCRLVNNSSVRALSVTSYLLHVLKLTFPSRADDAKTDVIFNIGSILFPIVGFYGRIWWLDALGGLLLSLVVIMNWSQISVHHVRNLTGFSAQPDERNLLLYLTMRFATAIRQIQNLRAYHAGDKLFVEVDIVLSANTPLKDSHDLSEVLTYFLESVPIVDRAFVHVDYTSYNAPTHIIKQHSS
ncbi:Metal tolerance protein 3 [Paramyrothecium foliicola]|nr:Metal tolerance protein 3 [Paramyrothecium foliicola]